MTEYEVNKILIITLVQTIKAESPKEALDKNTIPYDVKTAIEEGYLEQPVGNPCLTTRIYEVIDGEHIEVLEVDENGTMHYTQENN